MVPVKDKIQMNELNEIEMLEISGGMNMTDLLKYWNTIKTIGEDLGTAAGNAAAWGERNWNSTGSNTSLWYDFGG